MPGDPIEQQLNQLAASSGGTVGDIQAMVASYRARFGPDQPIWRQFVNYLADLARFDLGYSLANYPERVSQSISAGLPWTLGLLGVSTLISFAVGTLLGGLMAWPGSGRLVRLIGFPIIMLSAKGEEAYIVHGLEIVADDYLPKPFSPQVLLARVRAMLRRHARAESSHDQEEPIEIFDLFIHPGRNRVLAAGAPVDLTYTEFRILLLLAGRPGWVFSRSHIVDAIHGDGYAVTDRAVDVQIVGLRKKLGECGRYIETVRGVGYRFTETE